MWDHGWGWWPGNTMEDDTSGDYMDMDELRGALQTVGGVDMVGWDSCFSQTIEVQAQFRGFAKAMAGSEDSIGYSGFAYDYILPRLQATPTMDAYKLAILAAKSMKWHHDKWTLASTAVALDGRWDTLTSAVSDSAGTWPSGCPRIVPSLPRPQAGDSAAADLPGGPRSVRCRPSAEGAGRLEHGQAGLLAGC